MLLGHESSLMRTTEATHKRSDLKREKIRSTTVETENTKIRSDELHKYNGIKKYSPGKLPTFPLGLGGVCGHPILTSRCILDRYAEKEKHSDFRLPTHAGRLTKSTTAYAYPAPRRCHVPTTAFYGRILTSAAHFPPHFLKRERCVPLYASKLHV